MDRRKASQQLRIPFPPEQSFRRKDFVVSPVNAAAVRLVDAWPEWHAGLLCLTGPKGSGKTHLARAWAARAKAVVLARAPALEELPSLRGRPLLFERADLCPDDMLFHLINMAGEPGGALLLVSRVAPALWPASLPDLRSRLDAMAVAELGPPDDIVLRHVLAKLFRERHIRPPEDLFAYLLRRIERSADAAEQVVAKLDEAAAAQGRPVSRALARELMEQDETGELFEPSGEDKREANA
jgi:chromosomal replication initiation ATPase DnaA